MINARQAAAQVGAQVLTPRQQKYASLRNVLTLFTASDLSESERMEMGLMLQRFIVEGFIKGLNMPRLMKERRNREGVLHVGFSGGHVPHRNSIQFDRDSWRTQAPSKRFNEFLNKVGTRFSAQYNPTPPPRTNAAPRHSFTAGIRSGDPKKPFAPRALEAMAQRVIQAVAPSSTVSQVFEGLRQFQTQAGIAPPTQMTVTPNPTVRTPFQAQLKAAQEENVFETRSEMVERGVDPLRVQNLNPRSGVASPRPLQSINPQQAAQATGRPNRALIYQGSETYGTEVNEIKENLTAIGTPFDVVSNLGGVDYSQYGAIIMPGGGSTDRFNTIGSTQVARLKTAIAGGLNYLGHCAGAFFIGGGRLGISNYIPGVTPSDLIGKNETYTFGNFGTRNTSFFGGPTDLAGYGGTVLGRYSTGEVSMTQLQHGQGQVIVTSGHPSVERGAGDQSDDDLHQLLLRATMAGVTPSQVGGGTTPPPTGGPPNTPGGPVNAPDVNSDTVNYNVGSPSVTPWSGMPVGGGGGGTQRAPHRKTPVAGSLPDNVVQSGSFAAALKNVVSGSTPMLQGLAGALHGYKG